MKLPTTFLLFFALLPNAASAAGNSFHISACNLGCSDGSQGAQISCSVVAVPENVQLLIEWSEDVEFSSISFGSLRIVDVQTGLTPTGTFTLKDARTIAFTPSDPGLDPATTYQIQIPGTAQGDSGPFVLSTSGVPNLARLLCTFTPSGPPSNIGTECSTTPNSVGAGAVMTPFGSSSLALNDLCLVVDGLPPSKLAVTIVSDGNAALPFGDGVICLGEPVRRLAMTNTRNGTVALDVDWTAFPPGFDLHAGGSVWFQLWYRDPMGGSAGFNLSDSYFVDVIP